MAGVELYKASLVKRYYDRRALSSIGQDVHFKMTAAVFGRGFLTTDVDGKPVPGTIPMTASTLETEVISVTPTFTYANGIILVRAAIPENSFPAGESHEINCVGIRDDLGGFVAFLVGQPLWVNKDRGFIVEGEIHTNIA